MRRVKFQDGSEKFFNSRKHQVGEWYQSLRDEWYIVTSVEAGEAVDRDGLVDRGWMHELRLATEEEIKERTAEFAALTAEERTQRRLADLTERFPMLDWRE